jgi:hypothetical protein
MGRGIPILTLLTPQRSSCCKSSPPLLGRPFYTILPCPELLLWALKIYRGMFEWQVLRRYLLLRGRDCDEGLGLRCYQWRLDCHVICFSFPLVLVLSLLSDAGAVWDFIFLFPSLFPFLLFWSYNFPICLSLLIPNPCFMALKLHSVR